MWLFTHWIQCLILKILVYAGFRRSGYKYDVLKIPHLSEFCWLLDWLTDWLTDWLACLLTYLLTHSLTPSDKHNSTMVIVTGLISTLLCPEMCLFANCSSSNACIMVLPKLTFVLYSFLHYHIGDNLHYAHYSFSARLE